MTSMVAQDRLPARWIVVNDGSRDETPQIIDEFAHAHSWIRRVDLHDRGFRLNGSGVMQAVAAGLAALDVDDWDYLVKLDADVSFPRTYFRRCLHRFERDAALGIGGGVVVSSLGDGVVSEQHPRFHVRGATKIYRRACWDQIGGLHLVKGWDTLDEVKATMLGWRTESFADLEVVQHRYTGEASGQLSNWRKNGEACYVVGYHPVFLMARALVRATRRPYAVAGLGLVWGYVEAALRRRARIPDPDLVRYLRRQQLRRLVGLPSVWT
jgi:glycosyltransferase involved in cell wall biosynthesis